MLPLIAQHTRGSQLVLNFSIDDIGERHDRLRGHRNNYDKVVASYRLAKRLQREHDHLVVGIHTVISKFNADRIGTIADRLEELEPDSYITEIAEQRVELGTEDKDIAPDQQAYGRAVDALAERMRRRRRRGRPIGRLVESLRLEYYELVKRILAERTQVIPCYAGWASAHLAPDGDVWGCCVRAEPLGNVRDADYDFRKVWFSDAADAFRSSVRAKECACPLANASYTNMLLSPRSLLGVARNYLSA
jgi:MoaA/NifB/PqqE/SkfB family radical SAM enzyme